MISCEICKQNFEKWHDLTQHLRNIHKTVVKDYYDTYIKHNNEGTCKICGNATKFLGISQGYREYCSVKCKVNDYSLIEKAKTTSIEKYGVSHYSKSSQWLESVKETNNKKFGTDFAGQNKTIREQIKKTCNERYGTDTYSQTAECKEKVKQTIQERYGVDYLMQSEKFKEKSEQTCLEKYGKRNVSQVELIQEKKIQTNNEKYGVDWYSNPEKTKETCFEKYGVSNYTKTAEYTIKTKQTNLEKYGKEYYSQTRTWDERNRQTNLEKYGVEYPAQNHDIRCKAQRKYIYNMKYFDSSWELVYYIWLKDNNIKFEYQPNISLEYMHENIKHVYHPDFLIKNELVEIKGAQFFEDGKMINPYDRNQDALYEAKHKCMIDNNVKIVTDCTEYRNYVDKKYGIDYINKFKHDNIDNIYNSLGEFPYISYDNLLLNNPYRIIQTYHKSIWEARVGNKPSPLEAWSDKNLLYRVISNRLIYQKPPYNAAKIRQGLNVTKLAPKVSVFDPELAKRLINTFLPDISEIFDPFSGFSGRMLGAALCGKKYIGQDINKKHVSESNSIINDFNLTDCNIIQKDIFESTGEYESLFTCSPYKNKEKWNDEDKNLSCDEWIDICLNNFKCKKYLFVVDNTEKYKDNIVEVLQNNSHLNKNEEYIILL